MSPKFEGAPEGSSHAAPETKPLAPRLRARCASGVGEALGRHRHSTFEQEVEKLRFVAESGVFARLPQLVQGRKGWGTEQQVEEGIERLVHHLNRNRDSLLAALYNPLAVIMHIGGVDGKPSRQWAAWCWITEAAWRAVHPHQRSSEGPLTDIEMAMLSPVASRQRFLALSEVYRYSPESLNLHGYVRPATVERVFGRGTTARHVLHTRAREAREEWASFLARHESLPALDRAKWDELESETDLLLFERQDPYSKDSGIPLAIHQNRWSTRTRIEHRFTREDRRFATSLLETHHLPRFRLRETWQATSYLIDRQKYGWIPVVGIIGLAALTLLSIPLSLVIWDQLFAATGMVIAPLLFTIGVGGVVVFGRLWAMPWMLRVPAAATIGLLMLTTMNPAWWHAAFDGTGVPQEPSGPWVGPHPLSVSLLLAVAAFAYLLVNVRNTGVGGCMALRRACVVWLISALHSFLVALAGLSWVVPLFSEDGDVFVDVWTDHPGAALTALIQASAWCLVAGVFSQILWDDRPLTAPLAHAHWRADER